MVFRIPRYSKTLKKEVVDESARIDSSLCSNNPYLEVFISTGLKNISFQESNLVIGIPNNYRAGIIVSRHFFLT